MEKNESMTSEQRHGMIEEIIKTEWIVDMFMKYLVNKEY